jgi:hypothetical protein
MDERILISGTNKNCNGRLCEIASHLPERRREDANVGLEQTSPCTEGATRDTKAKHARGKRQKREKRKEKRREKTTTESKKGFQPDAGLEPATVRFPI